MTLPKTFRTARTLQPFISPASRPFPEVTASLVEEGMIGKWHVAVPKAMTAQQLHTQLQNQLSYFGRDMNQWPANETDAYRMVSQRIVLALYNIDTRDAGSQRDIR